jgi:hypothetical protein
MRTYFSRWLIGLLFGIVAVGTMNWYLDPYGYWGNADGVFYSTERQFKASQINHFPHDALLLGTSRFTHIDPKKLKCRKFFNAAFSGASLEEIIEFVKKFVGERELIILGLDFQMFEDVKAIPNEQGGFGRTPRDFIKHLLSLELVFKGILAAKHVRAGLKPRFLANGQLNTDAKDSRNDRPGTSNYLADQITTFGKKIARFRKSTKSEESLKRLKQLLKKRTKRAIIVFNPVNRILADKTGNLDALLPKLSSIIREVFPKMHDLSISQYADTDRHYKFDYSHYTPETGASFINEILRQVAIPCRAKSKNSWNKP